MVHQTFGLLKLGLKTFWVAYIKKSCQFKLKKIRPNKPLPRIIKLETPQNNIYSICDYHSDDKHQKDTVIISGHIMRRQKWKHVVTAEQIYGKEVVGDIEASWLSYWHEKMSAYELRHSVGDLEV